ncbi:MAG: homoserine kinase [Candidatus Bathyarchaeia archaeon]|nr:homoserine kinase [Candidatus Bathyarchaeota archaeon]
MSPSSIEAIAPATSANLGAGFDVFGVALDSPLLFDRVLVEKIEDEGKIEIEVEGEGAEGVPREPERNTAGIVARELLRFSGRRHGLKIVVYKGIRPGSGLGSSAASAAATAVAINELLNLKLSQSQLIDFAALGELASAGAPHADNVSAAILGDFIIITSREPLEVLKLKLPDNAEFAIVLPEIKVDTGLARALLPKKVDLSSMVYNIGRAATFVAGIALNNVEIMGRGMMDSVIEPARAPLIPGLSQVKERALKAGAAGVAISGAGPSVIALVDSRKARTETVAMAMKEAFEEVGIGSRPICARPGPGAKVIRREVE